MTCWNPAYGFTSSCHFSSVPIPPFTQIFRPGWDPLHLFLSAFPAPRQHHLSHSSTTCISCKDTNFHPLLLTKGSSSPHRVEQGSLERWNLRYSFPCTFTAKPSTSNSPHRIVFCPQITHLPWELACTFLFWACDSLSFQAHSPA
jgi:hypothetical protein